MSRMVIGNVVADVVVVAVFVVVVAAVVAVLPKGANETENANYYGALVNN